MGWWASLKERVLTAKEQTVKGSQWFWHNASTTLTHSVFKSGLFKFVTNTNFHILEQGLALRKAIPTLVNNQQAHDVLKKMGRLVVNDVIPLVALNAANNAVQNYYHEENDQAQASLPYTVFLGVLTLGNYWVFAYTSKRGVESVVRGLVIDSFAPTAFNSNKVTSPPSVCLEQECNIQRKLKGMGREIGILWANKGLIWGVSCIPYVGSPIAQTLTVLNNGRYVTRAVTPERCERHKYMEQEFVLALGLTYECANRMMNNVLQAYIPGPFPFIYLFLLQNILLQLQVNLAAHMDVPLVEPKNATFHDVFHYYERGWRFFFDVLWAGLLNRVPKDFKPQPGEPPIISLSIVSQFLVRLLNSDLEKLAAIGSTPKALGSPALMIKTHPTMQAVKNLIIPSMFRSTYDFTRDPIIAGYWEIIRADGLSIFNIVEGHEKSSVVATMAWSPNTAAVILDYKIGIPRKLTKIILMLNKEEDFWAFTHALKAWFARHGTKQKLLAAPAKPLLALRDDKPLEPLPPPTSKTEVVVPSQLITGKPSANNRVVDSEQLVPRKKQMPSIVASPDRLFTRKERATASFEQLFGAEPQKKIV